MSTATPEPDPDSFEAHYTALVVAAFKLRGIVNVCRESEGASESIDGALLAASDALNDISDSAFQMESFYKADTTVEDV